GHGRSQLASGVCRRRVFVCSPFAHGLPVLPAPAAPEPHPRSLHDALPICPMSTLDAAAARLPIAALAARSFTRTRCVATGAATQDRKSTRLNSSHVKISYAVFCLKKKKLGQGDIQRRVFADQPFATGMPVE